MEHVMAKLASSWTERSSSKLRTCMMRLWGPTFRPSWRASASAWQWQRRVPQSTRGNLEACGNSACKE